MVPRYFLLGLLVLSPPVLNPVAAAAAPAEIASVIHADAPYGSGKIGFLFVTAYTATLWTDAAQWSMDAPFALTLQYGIGFDTDEMVSRTLREMQHVDPQFGAAQAAQLTPQLNTVFAPVKSGDRITALYAPGKPVQFYRDGVSTGSIAEAGFDKDFFGIWLSPQTSEPSLRGHLLKLK